MELAVRVMDVYGQIVMGKDGIFEADLDGGSKLDLDLSGLMGERRGSKLDQAFKIDVNGFNGEKLFQHKGLQN